MSYNVCHFTVHTSFPLLNFQLTVHRFLPFGLMAGLAVAAAVVCMTLPETYNQPTAENLSHDETKEKDENKNAKSGTDEESTLM